MHVFNSRIACNYNILFVAALVQKSRETSLATVSRGTATKKNSGRKLLSLKSDLTLFGDMPRLRGRTVSPSTLEYHYSRRYLLGRAERVVPVAGASGAVRVVLACRRSVRRTIGAPRVRRNGRE